MVHVKGRQPVQQGLERMSPRGEEPEGGAGAGRVDGATSLQGEEDVFRLGGVSGHTGLRIC